MDSPTGKSGPDWPVVAGAYAVLFLLGVVEAMIGSFQYSREPKPVPVAALVCCAVILTLNGARQPLTWWRYKRSSSSCCMSSRRGSQPTGS